ncbi:MAG: 4Fe-4S binding protein [Deltaproteobacteria bacterium]|nr:4Fe-4S binding protein [Deltaproteobacteria bacterium]
MVVIDPALCTGCGACVDICPAEALRLEGGVARVDARACLGCGVCVPECTMRAITQPGLGFR